MKVEFIGTYVKHVVKKTKTNKDYAELVCKEQFSNRDVRIYIFKSDIIKNLDNFKENSGITIIFETWYSSKNKANVIVVKDVVAY